MKAVVIGLFLGLMVLSLSGEELFQAKVYKQDSNPPQLLFLHYNEIFSRADTTFLIHYYLLPDSTVSVRDEIILFQGRFLSARSQFFEVGETGEVIRNGDKMMMRFIIDDQAREKHFDYQEGLLFGPMFNDFVEEYWDNLIQNERMEFFLPAPDVLKIARFGFERVYQTGYSEPGSVVFKMDVVSWFLKLFINPTYFVYDYDTKLLKSIHGVTILRTKEKGKWQKTTDVDIYYDFGDGDEGRKTQDSYQ